MSTIFSSVKIQGSYKIIVASTVLSCLFAGSFCYLLLFINIIKRNLFNIHFFGNAFANISRSNIMFFAGVMAGAIVTLYIKSKQQRNVTKKTNLQVGHLQKELANKKDSLEEITRQLDMCMEDAYRQHLKIEYQNEYLVEINKSLVEAKEEIEEKNRQLQSYNQLLEQHVEQRTLLLRKTNEELIATNQELDTFIYKASHDLLGPVSSLKGLYNIMETEYRVEEKNNSINGYLDHYGKTVDRLHQILLELIGVMSIKERTVEMELVDIKQTIMHVLDGLSSRKNYDFIQISIDISPVCAKITTDRSMLEIMLKNIIANAIDFTSLHQSSSHLTNSYIHIEVTATELGYYCIKIKDNGMCIPDEIAERIFSMFFKGSEKSKGVGLGLYSAGKAAGKLGGKITYKNDAARGEKAFAIIIPKVEVDQKAITSIVEELPKNYLPEAFHRLHPLAGVLSVKDKACETNVFGNLYK